MIALLARMAVGIGVPERFAKAATIAALVVALVVGLGVAKCAYDRSVIRNHDARQDASTAKADRRADNHAADQRRADDARAASEADQLEKVRTNAPTDLDRRLARHRCLRLQQAARAGGREPPACG